MLPDLVMVSIRSNHVGIYTDAELGRGRVQADSLLQNSLNHLLSTVNGESRMMMVVHSASWFAFVSQHQLPSSRPNGQQRLETSHLGAVEFCGRAEFTHACSTIEFAGNYSLQSSEVRSWRKAIHEETRRSKRYRGKEGQLVAWPILC
jgi:hypothetical protein